MSLFLTDAILNHQVDNDISHAPKVIVMIHSSKRTHTKISFATSNSKYVLNILGLGPTIIFNKSFV